MTIATTINLQDAGLFSSLAYAATGVADSIAWGLEQPGSTYSQYASALKAANWVDITGTLSALNTSNHDFFFNEATNTSFHVYENSVTHQVVIAFRGSTPPGVTGKSLTNWAADLTTSDEGYTSYEGIVTGANQALNLIENALAWISTAR